MTRKRWIKNKEDTNLAANMERQFDSQEQQGNDQSIFTHTHTQPNII